MAAGEGQQIVAHISKRLRTLRKKYNRIAGFEESISQGKTLNKDQEEIVRSKPAVAAAIQELENLRLLFPPPASAAVAKEIILAVEKNQQQKEVAHVVEEVMTTTLTETEDCKISVGLDDGEVSKDDTCSACSGSSLGVTVTPSPTSEKVEEKKVEKEEDEGPWIEVTRRRRSPPQGPPQEAPRERGQGRGRGRQGPPGRKTYNRQWKRPTSN